MVSPFLIHRLNPLAEAADLVVRHYRASQFTAEVVTTDGNKINVRRTGFDIEGPYPAADGLAAAVSPGDIVKVARVGRGAFIVEYKVTN